MKSGMDKSMRQNQPPPTEINRLMALFNTRRYAELETRAQSLLKRYPDSGYVWKGLALSLQAQRKDALHAWQKTAELMPDDADNHYNLGNALWGRGQMDTVAACYRRALKINPDFAEAHYSLGTVLHEMGRYEMAVASLRRAVELKPDYAVAHNNLGFALKELDQFDAALASYRRALEIDPKCVGAMLGISSLSMVNGKMQEAEDGVNKVLQIEPGNLDARLTLAKLRKTKVGDENLGALLAVEESLRNNRVWMPNQKAIDLHFALGKCFDDLGDHHRSFAHFIKGCRLKRATLKYDPDRTTQYVTEVMQMFGSSTMERLRGNGNPSRLPIFVLGMPRSGTTLVEQIIASHPDVYGAGELSDLNAIANRSTARAGAGFPGNIHGLDRADLAAWAADYVAGLHRYAPEAKRIINKMPTNFIFIGLIHLMLPNAKIIHLNRNPVDTCLSCFMQPFSGGNEYTYDLRELGRYYVDYTRLMEHWRKVLPAGAFLDVRYEDIIADEAAQARNIIDFCGLDWSDSCIDYYKHDRPVNTASMTQVRQPIYKSSVERRRPYEKFLGPLLDTLGDLARK